MGNCNNYSYYPNLLLIVKSNKRIDDSEIIKPDIIKGFDFSLTFLLETSSFKDSFLSLFLLRRFENNFLTLKIKFVSH